MPKGSLKRKIKKEEDDEEDDDEEIVKDDDDDDEDADDDEDEKPKKKKTAVKKPALPPGEAMYDLGGKRKLTFSSYKGQRLVGIREYYDDKKTGEEKVLLLLRNSRFSVRCSPVFLSIVLCISLYLLRS